MPGSYPRLAGLALTGFVAACGPAPVAADYTEHATAIVQGYVAAGEFSGAVIVAVDGAPILRRGFGFVDREARIANTPETRFRIGSITKSFTAVAILQLAERGKLGIDDPVSRHYPAAPAAWEQITLRHLLAMRSGIPNQNAYIGRSKEGWAQPRTPEEVIGITRDLPLRFEPGTQFEYSNSNYTVLGAVIERTSGQSYADYMREHVFRPLGMDDTELESTQPIPGQAKGYAIIDGRWQHDDQISLTIPFAAGSLSSTVDDMLRWERGLTIGRLLSPASMEAMFVDHGSRYGLGWTVANPFGNPVQTHTGGIDGFHTQICRLPEQRLTIVVLANLRSARVGWVANDLARQHLGFFRWLPHACLEAWYSV